MRVVKVSWKHEVGDVELFHAKRAGIKCSVVRRKVRTRGIFAIELYDFTTTTTTTANTYTSTRRPHPPIPQRTHILPLLARDSNVPSMHLMFVPDPQNPAKRIYTLKKVIDGEVSKSAHPARFSPDDKYSRHRVTIKKRYGLLLTQQSECSKDTRTESREKLTNLQKTRSPSDLRQRVLEQMAF